MMATGRRFLSVSCWHDKKKTRHLQHVFMCAGAKCAVVSLYLLIYYSLIIENYTGNFIDSPLVDKQHVDTKLSLFQELL